MTIQHTSWHNYSFSHKFVDKAGAIAAGAVRRPEISSSPILCILGILPRTWTKVVVVVMVVALVVCPEE